MSYSRTDIKSLHVSEIISYAKNYASELTLFVISIFHEIVHLSVVVKYSRATFVVPAYLTGKLLGHYLSGRLDAPLNLSRSSRKILLFHFLNFSLEIPKIRIPTPMASAASKLFYFRSVYTKVKLVLEL